MIPKISDILGIIFFCFIFFLCIFVYINLSGTMAKKITTENFIERVKQIHGDKYDYSKVKYVKNTERVCIICKEHGEFWQRPDKHLLGHGCPSCSKTKVGTNESFIRKAIEKHGDKYDYSKVEYVNNRTLVKIICKEHGEFQQTPHNHLKGQGCPLCGLKKQSSPVPYEEFIKRAIEQHGERYIYPSKEEYVNILTKIPITCKEHGVFYQRPYSHIIGNGCPKCATTVNGLKRRLDSEKFIKRARELHGDKYDYSKVDYVTAKEKVTIICPKHGEFLQAPYHHLQGCGCPSCSHYSSKGETEIHDFVCKIVGGENVLHNDRKTLDGRELDIFVPHLNAAIEFNGLYYHNSKIVGKNYHIDKLNDCKKQNIRLLQIFEDEYVQKPIIVKKKIEHILGYQSTLPRIMGRKCIIKTIDKETAKNFLSEFHIQGFTPSTIYLGAMYNNELIGVMSFKKENRESLNWELTRFASNFNYICQGVGGKLFKHFIKNYEYEEIKSFADRRWTIDEENNIYVQLGFTFDKYTKPDYRYYNPREDGCTRIHKFNCRIHTLNKKFGLPLTMTEREMTEELGYTRIYDCGLIKYVYYNKIR